MNQDAVALELKGLTDDELALVSAIPAFAGLSRTIVQDLCRNARIERVMRGGWLFRQGEKAANLHVLLDGQVGLMGTIEPDHPDDEQTMVEILDAGEAFILAAVLTGKPYLVGAQALAMCKVLMLPSDVLLAELEKSPQLAVAMMGSLARHYRMMVREIKDLKLKSAAQRLARYLLELTPRRRGSVLVRLPHNKGMIAQRVGVRPETLSRAFAQLKDLGVSVDGQKVQLADLSKLAHFCHFGAETI